MRPLLLGEGWDSSRTQGRSRTQDVWPGTLAALQAGMTRGAAMGPAGTFAGGFPTGAT